MKPPSQGGEVPPSSESSGGQTRAGWWRRRSGPDPSPQIPSAFLPEESAELSLLHTPNFLALWVAQGVSLVVNTALQFVLLVLIVDETGSSVAGSGLIIFLAAPPVIFGPISGVIIDRLDKRTVLIVTNLVRGVLTALLLLGDVSVASIYAIAFLTATMGQFNLPAAQAAVPAFVPRTQLLVANSVFQLTTSVGQLVGMVMLAPLMLKAFGFDVSYIVAAGLLLATVPVLARLPQLKSGVESVGDTWRARLRTVPADVALAWHVIRGDRLTVLAMLQLSTGALLLFMFALLVPRFVKDVLDLPADNSVFIFWPTGLGALVGLRLLQPLARRYTATGIVTVALFGLTLAIAAFGGINFLVDFLQDQQPFGALGPDQVGGVSLLIFVTLVFAFPLGVTYAMVNAPAQTVLHERAPEALRGRVFAAQLMLANGVSMVALLIIGGVADAVNVEAAMFAVAGMTLVMGVISVAIRRQMPPRLLLPLRSHKRFFQENSSAIDGLEGELVFWNRRRIEIVGCRGVGWTGKPTGKAAGEALMIEMTVESVRISLMNYNRVVVLKEKEATRYLPIWIGAAEADAIAVRLQEVAVARPMTHDLVTNIVQEFGGRVTRVVVTELSNDTFFARIHVEAEGKTLEIDSRPSDAIALAVRAQAPIFAEEAVLEQAGVELEDVTGESTEPGAEGLPPAPVKEEELERMSAFRDFIDSLDLDDFGNR